jgi:DNA-directed RNA polymerase subunit E'
MYTLVKINDTVRVPPERFGEDLNEAIRDIVQKTFEGTIRRNHGLIVIVDNITPLGDGIVIHGDGGMYQKVEFEALAFNPILQEIVDGLVCEIVEFGAFVRMGPIDGLVHLSQITSDFITYDRKAGVFVSKNTKRTIKKGDTVYAKVSTISMRNTIQDIKIALTMRQEGFGKPEWIKEERLRGLKEKRKKK